MSAENRPTVIVNCSVPNGVQLRRHSPAVHPFAPQMPDGEGVMLKAGQNPGIDKEWFEGWREENKNLSLVTDGLITAIDEDPENAGQPRSAQRKEATMDHDVMHKDVLSLKKFRADAEEAIAFYKGLKAAGGALPAATGPDPAVEDLSNRLQSLAEAVTLLQQAHDQAKGVAAADLGGDFEQRLSALEVSKEEAASFSERLTNMLTWFEANQEGLEVLLSLDGEPDDAAKGPVPGAADGTGAAADKPAPDPAAGAGAAPQGDQAGTGQASQA